MSQRVPILVYHHVYPDGDPGLAEPKRDKATGTIAESELRRHLSYIADNGWEVVNTSRVVGWLEGREDLPERAVVLHFDNGWLDTRTVSMPVLQGDGHDGHLLRDQRWHGGGCAGTPGGDSHVDRGRSAEALHHVAAGRGAAAGGLGDRRSHGHSPEARGGPGHGRA